MSELLQGALVLCAVITLLSTAVAAYSSLATSVKVAALEVSVMRLLQEYVRKEECRDCPARLALQRAHEVQRA